MNEYEGPEPYSVPGFAAKLIAYKCPYGSPGSGWRAVPEVYHADSGEVRVRDEIRQQARQRLRQYLEGLMRSQEVSSVDHQGEERRRHMVPEHPLFRDFGEAVNFSRQAFERVLLQQEKLALERARGIVSDLQQNDGVYTVRRGELTPYSVPDEIPVLNSGTTTYAEVLTPGDFELKEGEVVIFPVSAQHDRDFVADLHQFAAYVALGETGCLCLGRVLLAAAFGVKPDDIGLSDEAALQLLQDVVFEYQLSPQTVHDAALAMDSYAMTPNDEKDPSGRVPRPEPVATEDLPGKVLFFQVVGVLYYMTQIRFRSWQFIMERIEGGQFNSDAAINVYNRVARSAMNPTSTFEGGMQGLSPELLEIIARRRAERKSS